MNPIAVACVSLRRKKVQVSPTTRFGCEYLFVGSEMIQQRHRVTVSPIFRK